MNKMLELTEEQTIAKAKIQDFLNSNSKVFVLKGYAGTGKTTLIKEILKEEWYNNYRKIVVSAYTNKATNVIGAKLYYADKLTLFKLLNLKADESDLKISFDKAGEDHVSKYDIIVVDEVSMVNDKYLNLLIEKINSLCSRTKLILVGDKAQLPPVDQKTDSVAFTFENSFELREIVRQAKNSNIFKYSICVRDFLERDKIPNIKTKLIPKDIDYTVNDLVIFNDSKKFQDYMYADFQSPEYKEDNNYVKVIAYRNVTINALNRMIREKIFPSSDESINQGENLILNAYYSDKDNYVNFSPSDEIKVLNVKSKVMHDGEDLGVKLIFPYFTCDVQRRIDGAIAEMKIVDPKFYEDFEKMLKEWGETIRKKAEDPKSYFRDIFYKLKKTFQTPYYDYAITSHKSQGSTYNRVYVIEDDIENVTLANPRDLWKSKYVAYTRASEKLIILNRNK